MARNKFDPCLLNGLNYYRQPPATVPRARRALQLEKYLAIAQQAILSAASMMEEERDQSCADDLHQLYQELRRIHEDQLKRRSRGRFRT